MYKFEIYRNAVNPSAGLYVRYEEDFYLFERVIKPTWNNLELKTKKDNDRFFFRTHLGGEFMLDGVDFDWVNGIRSDQEELGFYRMLKISELVNGSWTVIWKGFFSVVDGEFDLSKCYAKFSDLLVFDEYSVIIENIEREVNLIDIPSIPVNYERHTYDYEVDTDVSSEFFGITQCVTPSVPALCSVDVSEYFPDETQKWTLYRKTTRYGGQGYNGAIWSWIYDITLEYRRDIIWASSLPSAEWVLVESGDTLNKYARHYKDMDSLSFTQTLYSRQIKNEDSGEYCKFWYSDNDVILPSDLEIENERARTLSSAIYKILNEISSIQEYQSLFFHGVTNPFTEEANKLNYVVLWQLSDMKPTSDAATIGMYSFKNLENWLRMFQCGWYIDGDGFMRIEHRKFFDLGLSYSANSIGLDISGNKQVKGLNVISFVKQLPQSESLEFSNSNDRNFVGMPITYFGNIVNREEDVSVRNLNIGGISTDLTFVTSNEDEIGNDGFFMAACSIVDGDLYVTQSDGAIYGSDIWNADLSVANIMNDYWKWGRSTSSGLMNGSTTEFTAVDLVVQTDMIVTACDTVDHYKLVKTDYGDGNIVESSLALKDKKLTLSLTYDA